MCHVSTAPRAGLLLPFVKHRQKVNGLTTSPSAGRQPCVSRQRHRASSVAEYPPPMQLNDDVHVLPLSMVRDGQTRTLNVTLIVDPAQGSTLVDTGLPGQLDRIAAA